MNKEDVHGAVRSSQIPFRALRVPPAKHRQELLFLDSTAMEKTLPYKVITCILLCIIHCVSVHFLARIFEGKISMRTIHGYDDYIPWV